jgi:bile acid-coenzyme A ligase
MANLVPMGFLPTFHAKRDPNRPAITQNGETVTRGDFDARTNRRARQLQKLGVRANDFVAILMPNCLALFETTFALWKIGATPVPLSPNATKIELKAYFELVKPRAIIGDPGFETDAISIPTAFPIDESFSPDAMPECTPAYWRVSITGGSTGRPKLIVDHTPAVVDPLYGILGQQVDGVHINPGPLYHSGPFGLSHRGLFVGSHLINMEKFDSIDLLSLVEKHKVDWVYIVPTMMHRIWRLPEAERNRFDLSSIQVVFHMASACPPWLKENWINWLGPEKIWELYSSAENPGRTVINGREWLEHRGSVGRVQPGSKLGVFDETGRECAPLEVGEVYFMTDGGKDAAFHYIGAESKAMGDWHSLGDLGYLDNDGYLYIVDRRTDLIVSGGVNVYPAEIEAALDSHPSVESSVAVGLPDTDLGHRVHAIVQVAPHAKGQLSEDDLRAHLGDLLVRYKIPRTFEFVDEPLRDNTGKVRRLALREQRLQQSEARVLP